jgi:hypothetical protein
MVPKKKKELAPTRSICAEEYPAMNVLLIYPQFPDTFWSFTYALPFIGKKRLFRRLA